jgi:hypothetical protein
MFLVRSAFWLAVVVMLLPADKETGDQAPRVTAFEAISAAGTAVSDFSQFCKRNPEACATGGSAMHVFADKIWVGAKMLTGYFGDQKAGDAPAGKGTLKPDDIKPAWHALKKGGDA